MKKRLLRRAARLGLWLLVVSGQWVVFPHSRVHAESTDDYNVGVEFYKQERWDTAARSFRTFLTRNANSPLVPKARLYLGQALMHQGNFTNARDAFREFVKLHTDAPEIALARYRVGESSYFLQDDKSALQELGEFVDRHQGHELVPRARLYRGLTQLRLNDPSAAAETLEDLIGSKPDDALLAEARFGLARAFEAVGQSDKAIALYEPIAADTESNFAPEAQFRLATIAFNAKDYAQAAERYAAVAREYPDYSRASVAILNAGFSEYSRGEYDAALQDFEQAAKDPDQSAIAGMWIGLTHKQAGSLQEAINAFRTVYERDENQPLAEKLLYYWASCELLNGSLGEALRLFAMVANRWPDGERGDDSLHLATEAALRGGDLTAAAQFNERFESAYPESSLQWLQLVLAGQVKLALGDAQGTPEQPGEEAIQHYQQAVQDLSRVVTESEVVGTQQMARVHLARAYDRLDDDDKVIETLNPLVEAFRSGQVDIELADGLLIQAHTLNRLGRSEDAASTAQLYLDQTGTADPAAAWIELAVARTHLGDAAAVLKALDQLNPLDPSGVRAAEANYRCAEAAYAAKNWELAEEVFQRTADFDAALGYQAAALSGLGYSRHEAGQHVAAAESFERLLATKPADRRLASNAAYMLGLSLQLAGEADAAIQAYQSGLEQFAPGDERPLAAEDVEPVQNAYRSGKGAARLLRDLGRIADSDVAYSGAYDALTALPDELQGDLDKYINEWALLHYEKQQFNRSDELFKLLVEKRPESDLADDARLYLGESQFFNNQLDDAAAGFRLLIDDPKADGFVRHRALLLLMDISNKQEQWDELLKLADRFLEQFPESQERAFARYQAGDAALESGKLDRAITEFSSLAALKDDDPAAKAEWYSSVYVLLGEAQVRNKAYDGVEQTVSDFRQRFPTSPLLYRADEILGRCYKQQAMFNEAREAFTKVIASKNGQRTETAAKAQFNIAETYVIEKDYATALAEYYKVYVNYKIPEWQAPALFQAGQCDESLNNPAGAMSTYELLMKEFPESDFAKQAGDRLAEIKAQNP